jgi:FkbM family methyltransferase
MNLSNMQSRWNDFLKIFLPSKILQESFFKKQASKSLSELIIEVNGKSINSAYIKYDYLHFRSELIAPTVVLVGGHKGELLNNFRKKNLKRKFIIFEPQLEFTEILKSNFNDFDVTVFNSGLWDKDSIETLQLAGDASSVVSTGRSVTKENNFSGIIDVQMMDSMKLNDLLSGPVTFYFNCEGSEYRIIERILKTASNYSINTLFIQTHPLDHDAYSNLCKMRLKLCEFFTPILTLDWAWDIWVTNQHESI